MNIETGEIITDEVYQLRVAQDRERMKKFLQVPSNLVADAKKELAGRDSTFVDMKQKSPISDWASEQRTYSKINKRKTHRKIVSASKKKNR